MLKVNGYEGNYNCLYIYNDNGEILYKTERPYDLNLEINVNVRNARKLNLDKKDCFEIKTSNTDMFLRNGKDLYIHNSMIDIVNVEEKQALKHNGETNYKNVYTFKLNYLNGEEIKVDSDYYTRTEKTEDRLYRENIASIISKCLYGNKSVSHYEVEELLKKLNITIK